MIHRALLLATLFLVFGCGSDESDQNNSTASDMGASDAQAPDMGADDASVVPDTGVDSGVAEDASMDSGVDAGRCGSDQWLDTTTDMCQACPGADFVCVDLAADLSLEPSTNVVTITFDPSVHEVANVRFSGMKSRSAGVGMESMPLILEGTVDGSTMTFDASDAADFDELQLSRLTITDGCDTEWVFTLIARWEPGQPLDGAPGCI